MFELLKTYECGKVTQNSRKSFKEGYRDSFKIDIFYYQLFPF